MSSCHDSVLEFALSPRDNLLLLQGFLNLSERRDQLGHVLLEPLPGESRPRWRPGFGGERGLRARPLVAEHIREEPVAAVADVHGPESLPQ